MEKDMDILNRNGNVLINERILVEIGTGTIDWLKENHIDLAKIEYVIISDYAPNNFMEINLLFASRLDREDLKILKVIGPVDIKNRVVSLMLESSNDDANSSEVIDKTYNVEFIELTNEDYKTEEVTIEATSSNSEFGPANTYRILCRQGK